jgi:hypothetical protein
MGYIHIEQQGSQFAVDWELVEKVFKAYHFAFYTNKLARVAEHSESSLLSPLSWSLPTTFTVDVPWDKVRSDSQDACARDVAVAKVLAQKDIRKVAEILQSCHSQIPVLRHSFKTWVAEVHAANMAAIDESLKNYAEITSDLKAVRDSSEVALVFGQLFLTGPAAVAVLAGASSLKGVIKFQETGSVGAATLYAAGSFALDAVKISGPKLSENGTGVLILLKGCLESGTSLIAGDSLLEASTKGSIKLFSSGVAEKVLGIERIRKIIQRIPITVDVVMDSKGAMAAANKVTEKVVKKVVEKAADFAAKRVVESAEGAGKPPHDTEPGSRPQVIDNSRAPSRLIDEIPLADKWLLWVAIVNMQKGIGRGW